MAAGRDAGLAERVAELGEQVAGLGGGCCRLVMLASVSRTIT